MNKKAFGKISFLLIIVGFIVVVSLFFIFARGSSNQENNTDSTLNEQQANDDSEWKVYKNDIYGFEVQYPSYGFITADNYRFASDIDDYTIEIRIPQDPSPPNAQAFFIEVTGGENSLEEFSSLAMNISKQSGGSVSDIMVGGVPAKRTIRFSNDGTETRIILFVKNGHGYYITMLGPGFDDAEKMLTTFKFMR